MLDFEGQFQDAGTLDTHTATVDWGDGSAAEPLGLVQSAGSGSISGSHLYTADGTYSVTVTVVDDDGGMVSEVFTVVIANAALLPDTCHDGLTALYVGGTLGNDHIHSAPESDPGEIEVTINSVSEGIFSPTGRLVVYAQAGNDNVQVAGSIENSAWLYGGDGDDRLKGGAGDDVLLGEAGSDLLVGQSGRDLIVGGFGSDRIVGNADDDILIAGALNFADRDDALCYIMAEWTSASAYETRVANLSDGDSSSGLNGTVHLIADDTVSSDGDRDILTGSAGADWFFANLDRELDDATRDKITDLQNDEFADDLDWIMS